jgi:hypothetical protein
LAELGGVDGGVGVGDSVGHIGTLRRVSREDDCVALLTEKNQILARTTSDRITRHSSHKGDLRNPILCKLCHPDTASGRRKFLSITCRVAIDNGTPRIRIRLDVTVCIVGSA